MPPSSSILQSQKLTAIREAAGIPLLTPDQLDAKRKEIGSELKKKREGLGLSINFLAQLTGMQRNTIYKIEGGNGGVMLDSIIIYEHVLIKKK